MKLLAVIAALLIHQGMAAEDCGCDRPDAAEQRPDKYIAADSRPRPPLALDGRPPRLGGCAAGSKGCATPEAEQAPLHRDVSVDFDDNVDDRLAIRDFHVQDPKLAPDQIDDSQARLAVLERNRLKNEQLDINRVGFLSEKDLRLQDAKGKNQQAVFQFKQITQLQPNLPTIRPPRISEPKYYQAVSNPNVKAPDTNFISNINRVYEYAGKPVCNNLNCAKPGGCDKK